MSKKVEMERVSLWKISKYIVFLALGYAIVSSMAEFGGGINTASFILWLVLAAHHILNFEV